MSKITSKLQVTIPKAIADHYGLKPGDEIEWEDGGAFIRVILPSSRYSRLTVAERLRLFDQATARQHTLEAQRPLPPAVGGRGWTREELYERGSSR